MSRSMTDRELTRLAFDVDAALLVELGERLVANRSVAVAELIKNSYDADATKVSVKFKGVTGRHGSIVVRDNGSGMTIAAMKRGWMRIATNDATINSRSKKYGRPRTGAKGVGRFACGRLASRLTLVSIAQATSGSERVCAGFDWGDFQPGRDLSDVTAEVVREVGLSHKPAGTLLRLSGLTDNWTEKDIAELQIELGDLMNLDNSRGSVRRDPGYLADPGFSVHIHAPEFPRQEGEVGEPFLDASWGVLTGTVTDSGEAHYELRTKSSGSRQKHRSTDRLFPDLPDATFTIRMMVYAGSRFRESGYSLAEARALGRRRGGVRVYIDGFQVFSYGSPSDDWLELDQDRARRTSTLGDPLLESLATGLNRPMLSLPGNMNLFGAVALSRERNPRLTVSISRERLVQNESFAQLKRFVRDGINWMTVCYARGQFKDREKRNSQQKETDSALGSLRTARERINRDDLIPDHIKQTLDTAFGEVEANLTREAEARVTEVSMLRVLGSAGTTLMVFDHTLRAMANQLDGIVVNLESTIDHVQPEDSLKFQNALEDLRSWSSVATGQGSLVGLLVGPEARTRRKSLALRPLVERLDRGFAGYMNRFGINFENSISPTVRTPPLHEAEVYAVLLNLLTNSFKAVRGNTTRLVGVAAAVTQKKFELEVSDNGVGIRPQDRESVFEPFYTTSQPDPVLGIGAGLGLKIVRDLARSWGGDAEVVHAKDPWITTIRIQIPISAQ